MNPADIERIVKSEISGFTYDLPEPGSTVGIPWSEEKVRSYIPKLKAALVKPYSRRFYVRDTFEQIQLSHPKIAEYWVIAKTDSYIEFFDSESNEFGLADIEQGDDIPSTVGVRGDLVGVFCAM